MKRTRIIAFCLAAVLAFAFGCASPNVNPPTPRANAGYVDFYVEAGSELAWDVQQFNAAANQFKTVFSELEPPHGGILRLAFAPGRHQFRVTFLNCAITEPALFNVEVRDGRIVPVRIVLTETGVASVRTKEASYGSTVRGSFGRRTKINIHEASMYRVTAEPQESQPYQIKERMSYAQKPAE